MRHLTPLVAASRGLALPRPTDGEVVYLIGSELGLIKIGRSDRLRQRLLNLRTQNAADVFLLGWNKPGDCALDCTAKRLETFLHRHFRKQRRHGEWFEAAAELLTLALCFREGGPHPAIRALRRLEPVPTAPRKAA